MAVRIVQAAQTSDGQLFLNLIEANKHDLGLEVGISSERMSTFSAILADAKAGDIEGAFEAVISGGVLHPVEEAVRWLAGIFQVARKRATAVTEKPTANAAAVAAAKAAPAPEPDPDDEPEPVVGVKIPATPASVPAPAPVVPEPPKPNIFAA